MRSLSLESCCREVDRDWMLSVICMAKSHLPGDLRRRWSLAQVLLPISLMHPNTPWLLGNPPWLLRLILGVLLGVVRRACHTRSNFWPLLQGTFSTCSHVVSGLKAPLRRLSSLLQNFCSFLQVFDHSLLPSLREALIINTSSTTQHHQHNTINTTSPTHHHQYITINTSPSTKHHQHNTISTASSTHHHQRNIINTSPSQSPSTQHPHKHHQHNIINRNITNTTPSTQHHQQHTINSTGCPRASPQSASGCTQSVPSELHPKNLCP